MYKHKKIAITGGPCAGKTTAMQTIVREFTEKGYKVFVISETATDLINGGIKPFGDRACDMVDFQRYVLDLQLEKERIYELAAKKCKQNTIILCDRGIMDSCAYINSDEFKQLLSERHLNEMKVLSSYDLVIHLVTAADGAKKHYTVLNNKARTETVEEAITKDRLTLNSWVGHQKISILGNEVNFDEKIHNAIKAIYEELGDPYPIQKQQKYIVDKIDLKQLKDKHLVKLEIEQYFISESAGQDTMVRKMTRDGNSVYTITTKRDTSKSDERITTSKNITEHDYENVISNLQENPLRKCRYCFTYNKQYYRLDVFEKPLGLVILETEPTNENKDLKVPDFITVKKNITTDVAYRNASIYRKINNLHKNSPLVKKI